MTAIRSVVLGCGSYLPQQILTNAELAARIDTSDEWIVQRTGIRQRHIAAEGEFTSHLAINAARAALADAGIDAQSIDLIVLGTSTPDNTFPATAVAVQAALGITPWRGLRPAGGLLGLHLRAVDRRQFPAHRRLQARAGDRRRDLLADPRLERPRHLRAVRRRRRRRRAGSAAAAGRGRRSRHPDDASALRRPAQVEALCRWRAVLDPDGGLSADGGPRGVQARGRHDHRRDRTMRSRPPAPRPRTSTGSFRTRPTSESSMLQRTSCILRRRRWC